MEQTVRNAEGEKYNQDALSSLALEAWRDQPTMRSSNPYSTVWFGRDAMGREMAFKTIHHQTEEYNSLPAQARLHQQFIEAGVRVPKLLGYVTGADGRPGEPKDFLATEKIQGRTLLEELKYRQAAGKPFTPEELQTIISDASDQVQRAHDAGLYHRDLDLHNVVLDQDGKVVLLDFGKAKKALGSEDESSIYQEQRSRAGQLGTVSYVRDENFIPDFAQRVQKLGLVLKKAA